MDTGPPSRPSLLERLPGAPVRGLVWRLYALVDLLRHTPREELRHLLRSRKVPTTEQIPGAILLGATAGNASADWYIRGGRLAVDSLRDGLSTHGYRLEDFESVLDFGCGCARVLRQWPGGDGVRLHGIDINKAAIKWCREHIVGVRFCSGRYLPPLQYPDATFDLIYAFSVVTHWDEDLQRRWFDEFRRLLRPKGVLAFSIHGQAYEDQLSADQRAQLRERGVFVVAPHLRGLNRCGAFHTIEFVRENLATSWDFLDHIPEGARGNPRQDLVIVRRPES